MWAARLRACLATLGLLTRIPVPAVARVETSSMLAWFVPCGLLVGALGALAYWLGTATGSPLLASAMGCLALLVASGGLHMDGLMDTADALGSNAPRERMLDILRDSRVGAFGVMAFGSAMLLKTCALSALAPPVAALALVGAAATARAAQVALCVLGSYAREGGGMGAAFFREARPRHAWYVLLAAAPAVLCPALLAPCVGGLALALLLAASVGRRLGGHTGDTLGATSEACEVAVALLTALLLPSYV
jgi:adenosylcobinamide-GDP ribazoletransferase